MPCHFSTRIWMLLQIVFAGLLLLPLHASFAWSFSFPNTPNRHRHPTTNVGLLRQRDQHHHQTPLLFASSTDDSSQNATIDATNSTTTDSSTPTTKTVQKQTGKVKRRPTKLPFRTGLKYLYMVSKGQHPQYQHDLQEKYNTDCYIIWDKYVTLLNAKAIRDVLESENLEKPSDVSDAMKVMFYPTGGILGAQSNEEWLRQRRMTTPGLLSESVTSKIQPKLQQASKPLFKILDQVADSSAVLEMDSIFSALTMDTIALITLGKSFGMLDSSDAMMVDDDDDDDKVTGKKRKQQDSFTNALQIISSDAIRQSVSPRWILKVWKPSRKVQDARTVLDTFLNDCIEERLNSTTTTTTTTKDLLSILLEAEINGKITRDEVKAQLLTFIYAGYDTTAHTLSYMLYEISINQQLQDKIAKEVMEFLSNGDDLPASMEDDKLQLLDCTWMETLRKHPATASGPARIVGSEPIVVGDGIEIPANVQINIPPYALHRNTDYWSNPELFDVHRWTTTTEVKRARKQRDKDDDDDGLSFLPFGSGPRKCMGAKLARLEALSFMAGIFRRYEVTCVESSEPIPFTSLTTKPRDGIRFTFQHRK